jgi:glycosyltransferase involved in cell wall biosynthesis
VKLGIVIPAYQAQDTLVHVVARIPTGLMSRIAHIWIVDDGSQDHTAEVAGRLAAAHSNVECVRHPTNRGYGAAVKTGIALARKSDLTALACLHADGQYAPEELPRLLDELQRRDLDLVQGSRIASGTALSGGMPLYKYLAGRTLTWMENRVFGLRMSDYHSGYLIHGRRALLLNPYERLSDGFEFDLESIACAIARGLRVGEVPIPTHYAEEVSYLKPIDYGFRVLGVMGRYLTGHYKSA